VALLRARLIVFRALLREYNSVTLKRTLYLVTLLHAFECVGGKAVATKSIHSSRAAFATATLKRALHRVHTLKRDP